MNEFKFEKTNDTQILLTNAKKAVALCQEINPGSGMRFFIPPNEDIKHMPSDARVEFIYMPTYTLAAYLILCKLHLKDLFTKDEELEQGFKQILLACTARNMTGHGYDILNGLVDALEIFLEAPIKAFLAQYGSEYPEFAKCLKNAIQTLYAIAGGEAHSPWGKSEELVKAAKQLVATWETQKETA